MEPSATKIWVLTRERPSWQFRHRRARTRPGVGASGSDSHGLCPSWGRAQWLVKHFYCTLELGVGLAQQLGWESLTGPLMYTGGDQGQRSEGTATQLVTEAGVQSWVS